ncbi:hypothetical protein FACS1894166_02250 [Bacilli bacterium]|nr:hypothetical protein FACS1894166_02250 [Bacilli bacterium]
MLKTIEDTPEHVVFIFATTEIHKIPSTILSRCQNYQFNRLTIEQLTHMIANVANKENIKIDKPAMTKIVDLADGSGRDVLSVLEQMAMFTNNNIKVTDINNVFGLLDDNNEINLINLICAQNTKEVFALLDEYSLKGINFTNLTNDIVILLIDKLVYLQTKDETLLKRLNKNGIEQLNLTVSVCIALITI